MGEKIKVHEIELSVPLVGLDLQGQYQSCYTLLKMNGIPACWITVKNIEHTQYITPGQFGEAILEQADYSLIPKAIVKSFTQDTSEQQTLPSISVVVCTRNRVVYLEKCLQRLIELDYPEFEILIVDNAPNDNSTKNLVSHYPVRYTREDRPGLNWARNRGIQEAHHKVIAFTDDDAVVDKGWLMAIGKTFLNEEIHAVTGYVAPYSLDTKAQQEFEFVYGGMGHGLKARKIKKEHFKPVHLLWAGSFGVGVNMAFRKSLFQVIGDFDTALDVGTASRGGGDIEMLFRVVAMNFSIAYIPEVLVWHSHRKTDLELKKQILDNGCSFGCYLITCAMKKLLPSKIIWRFIVIEWIGKRIVKNLVKPSVKGIRKFLWYELRGMVQSPFAWRRSRMQDRKVLLIPNLPYNVGAELNQVK